MDRGYITLMKLAGAICFLVINQVDELPRVSIKSALKNTDLPILVGYISDDDISSLRDLPVQFVRILEVESPSRSGNYSAFDQDEFYRIVMNKWGLLLQNLRQYDFLVYSDIDVIWIQDAAREISRIFESRTDKDLVIQSFGNDEVNPNLCMGFLGIRNSDNSVEFLNLCKLRHSEMIIDNPRIGDDEIATMVMKEKGQPDWLQRLSPVYFPVGNVLTLFTSKPTFPGLVAPTPFIFHLNYVVGLENKRLMMRVISRYNTAWGIESKMTLKWFLKLRKKKLKFWLGTLRRRL